MVRFAAILGILLFSHTIVCLGKAPIDSLENALKRAPVDTTRVNILNELSNKFMAYQPEKARQYAEEALEISKTLRYAKGEVIALNRLGEHEFRLSNYAVAIDLTTRSLRLAEQIHDSLGMALADRVLGNIHTFGLNQYDLALKYQLDALKIYEKRNDKRNMASFYGNITWAYARTHQNLEEAHRLADLGVHLADSLGDKQLVSYNYNSKGLIFLEEGKPDSAIIYFDKSTHEAEGIRDIAVIAYNKSLKGRAYLRKKDFKKAIEMFEAASDESQIVHIREVRKDSYEGLSLSYAGLKNYPLAYKYNILFTQLRDSLVNWETTQKVLLTQLEFEEEKREAKIVELELSNAQGRRERIIYLVLFGIVMLLMIVVVLLNKRNSHQRIETNRLLQEKNTEIAEQNLKLKEANANKDKFFSIISHDLRSPVLSLKGLLGLLIGNEIDDQEFKSFAPKLNQRLMGVSETLENLLHWSQAQMKGLTYSPDTISLNSVIDKCLLLFNETAAEKKIKLVNGIPKDSTVYADRNQAELIFRNLIHNAIKFTADGGAVTISTRPANDLVEIIVKDTGIGMKPEKVSILFRTDISHTTHGTQGEKGTGLGLLLCKEMAENNGGKLEVRSEVGKGSEFCVFLKTKN